MSNWSSTVLVLLTLLSGFCSVRNSMSYLRPGRGGENRRSVFYTGNSNSSTEEWELVDAPPKDFPEQKPHPDTHRRTDTPCYPIRPLASCCLFVAQYFDKYTNNAFFLNSSICCSCRLHAQFETAKSNETLLFQIPLDQHFLLTLGATHRGQRGLCFETWWALGDLDVAVRHAVPRTPQWSVTAANLWRCSFAFRANRKN